jgi:hypothetical protein
MRSKVFHGLEPCGRNRTADEAELDHCHISRKRLQNCRPLAPREAESSRGARRLHLRGAICGSSSPPIAQISQICILHSSKCKNWCQNVFAESDVFLGKSTGTRKSICKNFWRGVLKIALPKLKSDREMPRFSEICTISGGAPKLTL